MGVLSGISELKNTCMPGDAKLIDAVPSGSAAEAVERFRKFRTLSSVMFHFAANSINEFLCRIPGRDACQRLSIHIALNEQVVGRTVRFQWMRGVPDRLCRARHRVTAGPKIVGVRSRSREAWPSTLTC